LHRHRAWWIHQPIDEDNMQQAATSLLGDHDFSAFRAAGCQASTPVREVTEIHISRENDWITIDITANAFLQHMVRNIVGTLVAIGLGDERPAWAQEVLESRDRTRGGIAAPAHGLTLMRIDYPRHFDLPVYRL
jgi:tRNA pseudouridine38-40 synthase